MSPVQLRHLPLPGLVPLIVSSDPQLLTAWNSIKAWFQKVIDKNWEPKVFSYHACLIMMACRFVNLRANKMGKEGLASRLAAGTIIKRMQDVSGELKSLQAVTDWLGQSSTLQASVNVGTLLFNALHQQKHQYGASQPLSKEVLHPVQEIWNMIALVIEIDPDPQTVRSKDVKDKLAWLQKQLDESLKRPHSQDDGDEERAKKVRTAANEAMRRIEVVDFADLGLIKRYENNIGIVPIEGPVKNRSVVTAYDVSSLAQGEWVNDAVIDAHLTLVCHCFNGLFQEGADLPKSPRYYAWSTQMSIYLGGRVQSFEEKHLRQEWPPARFPNAALEDVACHIFPIHVAKGHWILMVLQRSGDGQWTLLCYSSLAGYDKDFEEPWRVISSWLLFKSHGAFDVRTPRVEVPNPQPTQNNDRDCGVFVCGIVRWSLENWDLSTLTPSIIPAYRRRMMLELEKWSLSTNSL